MLPRDNRARLTAADTSSSTVRSDCQHGSSELDHHAIGWPLRSLQQEKGIPMSLTRRDMGKGLAAATAALGIDLPARAATPSPAKFRPGSYGAPRPRPTSRLLKN